MFDNVMWVLSTKNSEIVVVQCPGNVESSFVCKQSVLQISVIFVSMSQEMLQSSYVSNNCWFHLLH